MDDQKRMEQITKILDFVAGKGVPNGMKGYDQRLSSWLLMASDIIPFAPNAAAKQQQQQQQASMSNSGPVDIFAQNNNVSTSVGMNTNPSCLSNTNYDSLNHWMTDPSVNSVTDSMHPYTSYGNNSVSSSIYNMNQSNTNSCSIPTPAAMLPQEVNNTSTSTMNDNNIYNSYSMNSTLPSLLSGTNIPPKGNSVVSTLNSNLNSNSNSLNDNYNSVLPSSYIPESFTSTNTNSVSTSISSIPQPVSSNPYNSYDYMSSHGNPNYSSMNSSLPDMSHSLMPMPTTVSHVSTPISSTISENMSYADTDLLSTKDNGKRSHSDDEDSKGDKRLKRLEKNRIIARNCRKRKKERLVALEEEICQLKAENDEMKHQLLKGDGEQEKQKKQIFYSNRIKDLLHKNASDDVIQKEIESYFENWKYNNNERFNNAKYHLEQLKMLLLPTQITKMCVWSLQQDDDFYDEKLNEIKYGGSIWNLVTSYTKMSSDQKKDILSLRQETNQPIHNMDSILQIIDKLQENIKNNLIISCEQLSSMMRVLRPRQQAIFLLWCENNKNKNQLLSLLFSVIHKEENIDDNLSDSSDDNNDIAEL